MIFPGKFCFLKNRSALEVLSRAALSTRYILFSISVSFSLLLYVNKKFRKIYKHLRFLEAIMF